MSVTSRITIEIDKQRSTGCRITPAPSFTVPIDEITVYQARDSVEFELNGNFCTKITNAISEVKSALRMGGMTWTFRSSVLTVLVSVQAK
jgi:hypothetical protein